MKLQRNIVHLIRRSEERDDGYVQGTPGERIAMVWEITRDVWTFGGRGDAQQRLQRDATTLIRRER
jgi:hypothetical protein